MNVYNFSYDFSSRNIKKTPMTGTVAMPGVAVALPLILYLLSYVLRMFPHLVLNYLKTLLRHDIS